MPSVVVLIPGTAGDTPTPSSVSYSPYKQHKLLSLPPPSSASAPASSRSSKPGISAASTSSVIVPLTPPPTSSRQPLLPSSSSSSLSSSSLLRSHSSSSSSASSTTSQPASGSHSRGKRHERPIGISNPFGDEHIYNSTKRCSPSGPGVYTCRWRLRDKKGVLDPNGHQYCDSQLMTPDLLAQHVLTHHIPQHSASQYAHLKIACKWNSCFNRHYDPAGLASHLVHDHFTNQMGLKYACISSNCSVQTVLTSFEALKRHHTQYHAGSPTSQHRKVWQPRRPQEHPERASKLLAAIRKLDTPEHRPRIPVSTCANPQFTPVDPKIRALRQIELKRRYMDPLTVELGDGQEGQPWNRLYKRIDKRIQAEKSKQAAHDTILRATEYEEHNLDIKTPVFVEVTGDPILRAIGEGLQDAQLYHDGCSSPCQSTVSRKTPGLALPPPRKAHVLLPEHDPQHAQDHIGAASLHSVEREMRFDAALSKQLHWSDRVLGGSAFVPSHNAPLRPTASENAPSNVERDDDEGASDDWVPPLRLDSYHPVSRSRFAIVEDSASDDKPRAIRRPTEAGPHAPSSGQTTATSSRLTSPSITSSSSSLTPMSVSNAAQERVKREREHDEDDDLKHHAHEPPSSRIKLEGKEVPYIDVTGLLELESSARATSFPDLRGVSGVRLQRAGRKADVHGRPASES
ncbi:hypothetical protein EX895_006050 [Sporisorium graminicola]|uniref:Uncharacterized protein n=1 Tax=Sporisorium graminicola TaxID=280036 RepID=A0A4U7KL98_9BASI|nr:hypothetical protein EX895_006050 [Sporisorium graminicola]TKY84970.1 hypothetical protein EX895_006050 [Sporisorium graminicola]